MAIDTSPQGGHSFFPPSSGARLVNCPGSFQACMDIPRRPAGPDADRGTECHTFMECYYKGLDGSDYVKFSEPWQQEAVDDACIQVDEIINELIVVHGTPEVFLEHTVTYPYFPAVFGTVDVILWFPLTRHLVIIDYKFGKTNVIAVDNEQLAIYLLCALGVWDAVSVDAYIVQPRTGKPERWSPSIDYLRAWGSDKLNGALLEVNNGSTRLVPGEKQCAWCPHGKRGCEAMIAAGIRPYGSMLPERTPPTTQEEVEMLVNYEIRDMKKEDIQSCLAALPPERLSELGKSLPAMKMVIKHLEEALTQRQLAGEVIPGFKLVEGDKHRKWIDEEKADGFLQRKKLTLDERAPRKLVSPAKAETLIKLKSLPAASQTAFYSLVTKPKGEPVYAPVEDKRPPYEPEVIEHKEPEVQVEQQLPSLNDLF